MFHRNSEFRDGQKPMMVKTGVEKPCPILVWQKPMVSLPKAMKFDKSSTGQRPVCGQGQDNQRNSEDFSMWLKAYMANGLTLV